MTQSNINSQAKNARKAQQGRIRTLALIRKESRQMIRDKSTLTLGIILPILLLLLFGFGLSLDVKLVPVAVVKDTSSALTRDFFLTLNRSPYFAPRLVSSWQEAQHLLKQNIVHAIVRRNLHESIDSEQLQIIVNGTDANTANIMQRYLEGAFSSWQNYKLANLSFHSLQHPESAGNATVVSRVWYNHALESRFFLIPGVTALIMTLIGSLLTALVIAREWERGTFEALAATPVRQQEIIIGKIFPYFLLGSTGLCLCLLAANFIFMVPMRGSLGFIVLGSGLYLFVSLSLGLLLSAVLKNQFLASQVVLIISFLPTMMLSGFIFDLKSAPVLAYYIAHIFPATWYVELLQTLFLVGNTPKIVAQDLLMLTLFAIVFLVLTKKNIHKSLE